MIVLSTITLGERVAPGVVLLGETELVWPNLS